MTQKAVNFSALFSHKSEHWATPTELYESLENEFQFNFDPCPLHSKTDGLALDWHGKRVFCNPPYGPGIIEWLIRGQDADVAVFLLPARTDVRWFHDIVLPNASEIRFLRGRLRFNGAKNPAPFPSMIVVFKR